MDHVGEADAHVAGDQEAIEPVRHRGELAEELEHDPVLDRVVDQLEHAQLVQLAEMGERRRGDLGGGKGYKMSFCVSLKPDTYIFTIEQHQLLDVGHRRADLLQAAIGESVILEYLQHGQVRHGTLNLPVVLHSGRAELYP